MGWACSAYGMLRDIYRVLVGKSEGKKHLESLGADGRTVLKCVFKKWDRDEWTVLISLRIETGGGLL
jgi:hypothetical protein